MHVPSNARLDGLFVHIFSMPDLKDGYLVTPIIDEENDPVLALSYAVPVCVAGKFL